MQGYETLQNVLLPCLIPVRYVTLSPSSSVLADGLGWLDRRELVREDWSRSPANAGSGRGSPPANLSAGSGRALSLALPLALIAFLVGLGHS